MFKKNINNIKFIFSIIGSIFIIGSVFLIILFILQVNNLDMQESRHSINNITRGNITNNKIQKVEKKIENDLIGVLSISKIGLVHNLYDIDSNKNDVNKNIQIIKESTFPDTLNSNLILAAHSGNSNVAFFKDLNKLSIDDEVSLYYKNKTYKYKIVDIYKQEKTGKINIIRNKNETNITLITCDQDDKKYQIVYIGKLND